MVLNIDYLESLAKRFLPLDTWGFIESARTDSFLVYNSQWCRLRIGISVDWHHQSATEYLSISYGRLHALDNDGIMEWRGERCYCWHNEGSDLKRVLQYLDGLTPEVAYNSRIAPLNLLENFKKSILENNPNIDSNKINYMTHAKIWEYYGMRFFELFDLRRPELWDDYLDFLKEFNWLIDREFDATFSRHGQKRIPPDIPPSRRC